MSYGEIFPSQDFAHASHPYLLLLGSCSPCFACSFFISLLPNIAIFIESDLKIFLIVNKSAMAKFN